MVVLIKKDFAAAVGKDLAVDLGTANTVIYIKGKGAVLKEASVLAIENESKNIIAVGKEAKDMLDRTPENITIIKPLQNAVVADFDAASAMLKVFIKKAVGANIGKNSIVMSYPAASTQVEKMAAQDLAKHCVSGKVTLVSQPVATLIGEGISPVTPQARMVIDIGAGHTEVSVCIFGEVMAVFKENIGSDEIDQNIARYMRNKYKLIISNKSAEEIKLKLGSAFISADYSQNFMDVKGRSLIDNIPKSINVNSDEIREVIVGVLSVIPRLMIKTCEDLPAQIVADIMEVPVIVTGGTAQLKGLKEYIENMTGLKAQIAQIPVDTVALGMAKI